MKREDEDEVKLIIARKMLARTKRRAKQLSSGNPAIEYQIMHVTNTVCHMFDDVYNKHPACYAAILILAEAVREMLEEVQKMETGKVIRL